MKTHNLFIAAGVVAATFAAGSAVAAPNHGGSNYTHVYQTQHVQPAPRPAAHHGGGHHSGHHGGGHHSGHHGGAHTVVVTQPHHHHHHHHSHTAGNIILATALLVSAFM